MIYDYLLFIYSCIHIYYLVIFEFIYLFIYKYICLYKCSVTCLFLNFTYDCWGLICLYGKSKSKATTYKVTREREKYIS